jgi:hypothetical protein
MLLSGNGRYAAGTLYCVLRGRAKKIHRSSSCAGARGVFFRVGFAISRRAIPCDVGIAGSGVQELPAGKLARRRIPYEENPPRHRLPLLAHLGASPPICRSFRPATGYRHPPSSLEARDFTQLSLTMCVVGRIVPAVLDAEHSSDKQRCPVCGYPGDLGPSDHEPWCPCFMAGAIELEGQLDLLAEVAND